MKCIVGRGISILTDLAVRSERYVLMGMKCDIFTRGKKKKQAGVCGRALYNIAKQNPVKK